MVKAKLIKIFSLCIFLINISFITAQHRTSVDLEPIENAELREKIEIHASSILTNFNIAYQNERAPELSMSFISEHARNSVEALWATAPFQCSETDIITHLVRQKYAGGFELRNVPFTIKIGTDSTAFEDGVLQFDQNGNFEDLYFGIKNHQYQRLLRIGKDITDFRRRQIILNFVENFRTAYNRKDLDLLEKVFSENALIIVGRVIKQKPEQNDMLEKNLEKKKVELIKMSKKEYMTHLVKVFRRNKWIDVSFEDIEIVQHRLYNDIYGVQLKQGWKSSTYSDEGYLFLMIDFKDEDNPMIHVRAWQPEKATDPDSVISLGDFEIIQ